MRTQVAIIGGGPAGLLLQQLLHAAGVASVVLERHTREHVESRIRAGVLESITVKLLEQADVAARLHGEGLTHGGFGIAIDGEVLRIDLQGLTGGRTVTVYGQTEITRDLIDAAQERGCAVIFEAEDVALHDLDGGAPFVTWRKGGAAEHLDCDFVAGCDGFHGVSRPMIPAEVLRLYERVYPFGWLGVLADVPPFRPEVTYATGERGYALASMRSATRSRYYVQVSTEETPEAWPDERFWDEVALRLGAAGTLTRGPSIEKSVAPLRSFVAEPMSWKRLFLAGDAAHIVPPTGAKGLNLAASDVGYLSQALIGFYESGDEAALKAYSDKALARVWKAERFSWWMTHLLHRFPNADPIERKLQAAELDYLRGSQNAQRVLAENYVGLPA